MQRGDIMGHEFMGEVIKTGPDIDPGKLRPRIITHTLPLEHAPHGYDIFKHKKDNCEKVVLKP